MEKDKGRVRMALILGKKTYGRLETLQYANEKFGWSDKVVIGISAYYGLLSWIRARLTGRKVIYYCIDFYSPDISEGFMDSIFIELAMLADRFLCRFADKVWDISTRINEGRLRYGNYYVNSIIVPLSYPPHYFRFCNGNKRKVVFVGIQPYGLTIVNAVWLKDMSQGALCYALSKSGIGISLWKDKGNNYYGDPGKTKLYSACGLPVVMTSNTPYAEIIHKTQAGIVVPYEKDAVESAIKQIQDNYDFYKKNVKKTWEYIDADNIFRNIKVLD